MSGPSAGLYDPVQASFYSPTRDIDENGEPTTDAFVLYCTRHVRFFQKQSKDANREVHSQAQQVSQNIQAFRCRRDTKTEQLQVDMRLVHRGQTWEITGVDPVDYAADEVQVLVERLNIPTTWVPTA